MVYTECAPRREQFRVAPATQQPNSAVNAPLRWLFKTALEKATVTHSKCPSLIGHHASVDVKQTVYLLIQNPQRVGLSFASGSNRCSFGLCIFETRFHTAVERASCRVHKLLRTGGVPSSLTTMFWRWLTVSSVFTGRIAGAGYS